MAKVTIYLRVSTAEQTVENQLPALERWVADRGHELVAVYAENETAWRAGHQRELARLLDDIRSGKRKYDILLVWALDRLSRQGPLAVLTLIDSLRSQGCQVVSLKEPFTDLPNGLDSVMYSIVGWVARWESERRSERTKAGLERAVAGGSKLGRPLGSKDKNGRRRAGYLNRWLNKVRGGTGLCQS